jgi:GNAT superfamily N-acetyltransferase
MQIITLKDKRKHNWKKIHKDIVKGTTYENLGDYKDKLPNVTNYYCYEKETNKPVGYISLGFTTEYHNFYGINFIGVLPKYRNKKIGSKLINFAKKQAKKESYSRLFLVYSTTETRLERFNLRYGFIYENRYVNVQLDTGKKLHFCPIDYYNNKLKNRSKLLHSFDIMCFRL